MKQLSDLWQTLDNRRRVIVIGATIAMFAMVLAMSAIASKPSMALLYAGLDGPESGEVIAALEQRGLMYEVRGDSIYVDAARRDELRMTLAAEGLPATGGSGYELLDSMSGFGTTAQMFDAAYWRAKEGELARTIVSNPAIRSARVHISNPTHQSFRRGMAPTASVTVSTVNGGLTPPQAKALKFMVASAVAGMRPEDVSIIDSQSGLVAIGDEAQTALDGQDRAAVLKQSVERLLEARVGYGNAVVEVALETVTEREAITERLIDPEGRVAISTDTEERSKSADDTKPGGVSVASNLPEGDAGNSGKSQSRSSELRERTNYEVSETTREVLRTPGAIKRLSVAVLVDGEHSVDAEGNAVWTPRSDDELEALRALVASAVGFDEARGDTITLRSMQFEPITAPGDMVEAGLFSPSGLDVMQLVQLAVLAIVALVLGLFVMRPILMQRNIRNMAELPPPEPDTQALTGEIADSDYPDKDMQLVSDFALDDLQMPMAMGNAFDDAISDDPVARIKRLIEERQSETVEILRSWMDEKEETLS